MLGDVGVVGGVEELGDDVVVLGANALPLVEAEHGMVEEPLGAAGADDVDPAEAAMGLMGLMGLMGNR